MRFRKRHVLIAAFTVAFVGIGAAVAYHNLAGTVNESEISTTSDKKAAFVDGNGTELLVRGYTIRDTQSQRRSSNAYTGTLQPRYQSTLGFRVAGKISERLVEVGQRVCKGDVLFRIDPEDTDLQLRVAQADHLSTESAYDQTRAEEARLEQLRSTRSVSQSEYDLALSARDIARARLDASKRRLTLAENQRDYCDLVSDYDGLVTSIQAEKGQVVNVGQPVLQVMQGDELEAVVSLPESIVSDIKRYDAQVTLWSRPDHRMVAELRELSPIADKISRTFDARFRLVERPSDLNIGMTATVHLLQPESQGISVPASAIAGGDSSPALWKIEQHGKLRLVPIEILQYRSDSVLVRGPLETGDTVVSAGVQRLDENCRVRVWLDRS